MEKIIKVNCAIPCPHTCYFYDYTGKINTERIQSLLGQSTSDVVGWYKYRHSPGFKLTVREKVIHKELTNFFNTPADLFTTCLLTIEVSDNRSTHLFSQTFVRYSCSMYQPLPMHIVNLSDPNNSYKEPEPVSVAFKQLLDSLSIDLKNAQGVKVVGEVHNALQKETGSNVGVLSRTYADMFKLEEEIIQLKHALNLKTERKVCGVFKKEVVVENNNVDVGGGDVVKEAETVPASKKKGGGARKKPSKENVKTEEEAVKTRSQANRVSNNISYAQATQGQKPV